MDVALKAYCESVVAVCERVTRDSLVAAWVVGSLATEDFEATRSDIDLLIICRDPLGLKPKQQLTRELSHEVLPCPAHGLDLVVYRQGVVDPITRTPEYEFSISSGVDWEDEASFGGPYPGGLIDLALARQFGTVLLGPSPAECVDPIPEQWVLEELLASLRWHAGKVHDSFHDPTGSHAVLNACRALAYLSGCGFLSKSAGAAWLSDRCSDPILTAALRGRQRPRAEQLDRAAVLSFLDEAITRFEKGTT